MNYLEKHYNEIFKKYKTEELIKDINNYKYGSGCLYKTLSNFFEEEIWKCCGRKTKISPIEALENDKYTNIILEYIKNKPNFFTSDNEVVNVKSAIRNSFSWVRKVANFPCREAREIYFRYTNGKEKIKINCLDTSSGFGSRMSAVLLSGSNYFGIDPNKTLYKKLVEYKNFLYDNNIINQNQKCKLYCAGSEVFIPELCDTIDIAFTSPPYFNLERYSDDNNSSTKNYQNYGLWIEEFVKPTLFNTYEYLKVGGYIIINIKNLNKKERCFDDFFNILNGIDGLNFVEIFDMSISKKQYGLRFNNEKGVINNKEPVMCFRKVK